MLAAIGLLTGVALQFASPSTSRWIYAATVAIAGLPVVIGNVRNLAKGQFHTDTIAALAIISAAAMGEFFAGAVIALMQSGGEALEDYGLRRANRSLDNLLRRAPSVAHRKQDGSFVDVPAADVAIGDLLLVRPGDIIAADGIVAQGEGAVDESALTGEPVPLSKLPGDKVFSGTINLSGSFQVRTTNIAATSKYELIVKMVQHAQGERAPINRLANKYTPAFTLITLAVAIIAYLVSREPTRALAVLVVATPCPLIIATPLAVLSAMNRAAGLNIIVKSGAAIEQAGLVDTVVFDKTGTLTVGQPQLSEIRLIEGAAGSMTADELLALAAAVEMHSANVIASEVVQAARRRGLAVGSAEGVEEQPGSGVAGIASGRQAVVGSPSFLAGYGIGIAQSTLDERASLSEHGRTIAMMALDGAPCAMLVFEDRVRTEAPSLIRRLQQLGIQNQVMLTGDADETARSVAGKLGIKDVRSRMHPEDKLTAVRELASTSVVMMVGDGINDAPALSTAQVGVAMGGFGTGIATDAADVVITVENVERVADIIEIGRRMSSVAKQGIVFGIGVSTFLMVLAAAGFISPPIGALLQEAVDLATILNALRAR
jgi:heavy metal translocating P-type ATPase